MFDIAQGILNPANNWNQESPRLSWITLRYVLLLRKRPRNITVQAYFTSTHFIRLAGSFTTFVRPKLKKATLWFDLAEKLLNITTTLLLPHYDTLMVVVYLMKSLRGGLVFQNNETAAMLVYQENPLGVALFSYINTLFCFNNKINIDAGHVSENAL